MSPTAASPLDLALMTTVFSDYKQDPAQMRRPANHRVAENQASAGNSNPQVALDIPNQLSEPIIPNPNSSHVGAAAMNVEQSDGNNNFVESLMISQMWRLAVAVIFFATLMLPLFEVYGIVSIILYDMQEDAKCQGASCYQSVNTTLNRTYMVMVFGLMGPAVIHFLIGTYVFSECHRLRLRDLYFPMKIYGGFTAMQILILTVTLPTMHVTAGMAMGIIITMSTQCIAMSAVFCYPSDPPSSSEADQATETIQTSRTETEEAAPPTEF